MADLRRILLVLFFISLPVTTTLAQSGRKADPTPSPTPSYPEPGVSHPGPGPLQLKKQAKLSPPEFVDGERIYTSKQVDQKVHISSKPLPSYTREARRHSTRGLVVLRVILAADETVKHIEVVNGLPDGLSEKAMEAAQRIKFKPARKDGKPVSVWILLEYRFNIY